MISPSPRLFFLGVTQMMVFNLISKDHLSACLSQALQLIFFCSGGTILSLSHSADRSCGIPDGETIIMIGGESHNYVTR